MKKKQTCLAFAALAILLAKLTLRCEVKGDQT
jgi:hypothetical protein